MLITSTVGKIDLAIGRNEGAILDYMMSQDELAEQASILKALYTVEKSKHYSETIGGMAGISYMTPNSKEVPYSEFEETADKTFTHVTYKNGVELNREMIDDARIIDMKNRANAAIVDSYHATKNYHIVSTFINAAATSHVWGGVTYDDSGADGVALVSASHLSETGKRTTLSNTVASAFSESSLKSAENLFSLFQTESGLPAATVPTMLLYPYALSNTVQELVGSVGKLGTANNNKNTYQSKYNLVCSNLLDHYGVTDKVFLISEAYMKKCLFWIERIPFEVASDIDFNTDNWRLKGYTRFSYGFTDWQWVVRIGA